MSERAVGVVDTNVLLNLATPVVDRRPKAPSGGDPLKSLLTAYEIHIPASVLGEVNDATEDDDPLAAAAALVLQAAHRVTSHDIDDRADELLDYGLDQGETESIWLANELETDLFIHDGFNTTNYLFSNLALDDRNTLFTTPHILCTLATHEILPVEYVDAALSYYVETKGWDAQYVAQLRQHHLER
jgi:rRNA-processing protein FCF1